MIWRPPTGAGRGVATGQLNTGGTCPTHSPPPYHPSTSRFLSATGAPRPPCTNLHRSATLQNPQNPPPPTQPSTSSTCATTSATPWTCCCKATPTPRSPPP